MLVRLDLIGLGAGEVADAEIGCLEPTAGSADRGGRGGHWRGRWQGRGLHRGHTLGGGCRHRACRQDLAAADLGRVDAVNH